MAQLTRTINLLPEIFRTEPNKKFLASTLDQLSRNPEFERVQGFIGRNSAAAFDSRDTYVSEPTTIRQNYQLEPGIVFTDDESEKPRDALTYPGILDALSNNGADVSRHDRLFETDYAAWDPFIDLDKFSNFNRYYWLPAGPDSVDVSATEVPFTADFDVDRKTQSYGLSGLPGANPDIVLVRGGTYEFNLNQPGNPFWIQTQPGTAGTLGENPNISSRDVLGVVDNGSDTGTIRFNVPERNAQRFFYNLESIGKVDLFTSIEFDQIDKQYLDEFISKFGGIDGVTDLDNRTVVIDQPLDSVSWRRKTFFDDANFDTELWDETTPIATASEKRSVWRINLVEATDGREYISLSRVQEIPRLNKFQIDRGNSNANVSFYRDSQDRIKQIPLLSAIKDTLFYQDQNNPDLFGRILLVEQEERGILNINDILGRETYTSPNGVKFTNGLKVQFRGLVTPDEFSDREFYVEGVGSGIKLLPVSDFITPETYTDSEAVPFDQLPFDVGNFEESLNQPRQKDYITINRSSQDLNPWTRSNRWFHEDVIKQSAELNNVVPVLDNNLKAQRPILEFREGTRLFNFGVNAKDVVDVIDFFQTDAFSNVKGTSGYSIDGVTLLPGTRIIFANDLDRRVRNKIYEVDFSDVNADGQQQILLTEVSEELREDDIIVSKSGVRSQGKSFRYDGESWIPTQQKESVNQPPLFDVFDKNGASFGDQAVYPGSSFSGSKLFSYAQGDGPADDVLGFPLEFKTIDNVGDIVFNNDFYSDTFSFVNGRSSETRKINTGFVKEYNEELNFKRRIGWQPAASSLVQRQIFQFRNTNSGTFELDVPVSESTITPSVRVTINSEFVDSSQYSVEVDDQKTIITFFGGLDKDSLVEVSVVSEKRSEVAFYEIPQNLEKNPFNEESTIVTLGTIRNHYQTLAQNIPDLVGEINGSNNIRDLGNVIPFGTEILQHASSMLPTGAILRSDRVDFFESLEFNARAYEAYKARILDIIKNQDFGTMPAPKILDQVISQIASEKSEQSPFFWSDMVPSGLEFVDSETVVREVTSKEFDTVNQYDFSFANRQGLLVYVNDGILVKDHDYVVSDDSPSITINKSLNVGDRVRIREYSKTNASFVPNTPTKLGLYPAYEPAIFSDDSYIEPVNVIQGHDGSLSVAFGDIRDDVLLEFESRIYNNLKVSTPPPLLEAEVVPGKFRNTDYDLSTINEILSTEFLRWSGLNKLDYRDQTFIPDNGFTWNYSTTTSKIDSELLQGHWRGIYRHFYDTDTPHTTPWKMLGFSQKPSWWNDVYGPAPYTSNNLILWQDLAEGRVKDPAGEKVIEARKRPGLLSVIPVDEHGNLKIPLDAVVSNYNSNNFRKRWVFGDGAPVETAWRRSSTYPFAVQKLLALTKPAKYFSLNIDRDLYQFDPEFNQYLVDGRSRLDFSDLSSYGNGDPQHSYFNWVADYNQQLGKIDRDCIDACFDNIDVRLCYRLAGFTDKQYLNLFSENFTPDTQNTSLSIPEESYHLLLHKNEPDTRILFSSVIVQVAENGWTVWGNSSSEPYFEIVRSIPNGNFGNIVSEGRNVRYAKDFSEEITRVPYGFTFKSRESVVDFLISYGRNLEQKGMKFESRSNGVVFSWLQIAKEYLDWSQEGWGTGNIINLNPSAEKITINRLSGVLEDVSNDPRVLLNQNRRPLKPIQYNVNREDDLTEITVLTDDLIGLAELNFVNYEQLLVIDNSSVFSDLLYDPASGNRQKRLRISGSRTTSWRGRPDAPGFIISNNNIPEWEPNKKYARGEIVRYKGQLFAAKETVTPSEEFDMNNWVQSDFDDSRQGLLPNLATKADDALDFYNKNSANLSRDADVLGLGVTGFRPRDYLENLNLSDVTQSNVYSNFIGSKGTAPAAKLLSAIEFGKEKAEYDIFENWAVKQSTYGATDNRSFFEISLDQSLLQANPSLISVTRSRDTTVADQTVRLNQLFKESRKFTDANLLPRLEISKPDMALPTAGNVNQDLVDFQVFSLDEIGTQVNTDSISPGNTIWVAKDTKFDWNIYHVFRKDVQVTQINDNLTGQSRLTFSSPHGLKVGDKIIIKSFSEEVNGFYEITSVPTTDTALINFEFLTSQTEQTGSGILLKLESARVKQASDIVSLSFANSLEPGNRAWVDDDRTGKWQVLEKQNPFSEQTSLQPDSSTSRYGAAIAQGFQGVGVLVGAPSGGSDEQGQVFSYILNRDKNYDSVAVLSHGTPEIKGYGSSISAGDSQWAIIGAPESNSDRGYAGVVFKEGPANAQFEQTQILLDANANEGDRFGESVALSSDERVAYVAAPGANKVYVYSRVDRQNQFVRYVGDGTSTEFSYDGEIVIGSDNNGDELSIIVNNRLQSRAAGDYVVNTTDNLVSFASPPRSGEPITIARKEQISLTFRTVGDGNTTQYNIAALGNILESNLRVFVDGIEKTLDIDFAIFGQTLTFVTAPSSGSSITVYNNNLDQLAGVDGNIDSFSVLRNGIFLRANIDYTYDSTDNTIEFLNGNSDVIDADILVRAKTHFRHVNTIQIPSQTKEYVSGTDTSITLDDVTGIVPQMVITGAGFSSGQFVVDVDENENRITVNQSPDSEPSGNLEFSLEQFGSSLDTTTDGRQVSVGCIGNEKTPGQVFVFDRVVERFEIRDQNKTVYSPRRISEILASTVVPVKINEQFLLPQEINSVPQNNLNSTYTVTTFGDVDLGSAEFELGDIVEIETLEFSQLQTLSNENLLGGSEFGFSVSICPTNCSFYIGSPGDSRTVKNGGSAERFVNNPRVYGIETSKASDPDLTPGDTVRINNVDVEVSSIPTHVSGASYAESTFVISGGEIFESIQNVPPGIDINDTDFWKPSTWVDVFARDINEANISNIQAEVNNREKLVISAVEPKAQKDFSKLFVLPGEGSAYRDLGFEPIQRTQTIFSPRQQTSARFGHVVQIDSRATSLVIGAPGARLITQSTWQNEPDLSFDNGSTTFVDRVNEAGVVYAYDLLLSATSSPLEPSKFVFGQQIFVNEISQGDKFGSDVDFVRGRLLVGAPKREDGKLYAFNNLELTPSWQAIDSEVDEVDSSLINSIFVYDSTDNRILQYLDWIDPLQGKILGAAKENIDYITAVDPAGYNQGERISSANVWRENHVGEIWWDITNYRLTEYHSEDIVYSSRQWAQIVDGSSVDVYQWVESSVPPSQYDGPGVPKDENQFTVVGNILEDRTISNLYYFWVTNTDSISREAGKSLGVNAITQYIESPKLSGIPYIAPISQNTIGVFNCVELINRTNSILHIEFDRIKTENRVHVEFELIPENKPDGFLSGQLYRKLLDSLTGSDLDGNLVPDVTLPPSELLGVEFRPRQTMFRDREAALKNYLNYVNRVLRQHPFVEIRDLSRLESEEPIPRPNSGEWDKKLDSLLELSFQNLAIVPAGYRYLVLSDDTIDGLWSIYELDKNKNLNRIRIQTFNTRQYWDFVDWYAEGFSENTMVEKTVDSRSDLLSLSANTGDIVRVDNATSGKWEIYIRKDNSWERIAAQSATIQFDLTLANFSEGRFGFDLEVFDTQFFDERPVQETRVILDSINQDIFIDEFGLEKNRGLVLLFNYILSEQVKPEWLEKTSLIDIDHTVRTLEPFKVYQQDNQSFVADYINEVKPYHVKVRQFNLKYEGNEFYRGDITDFDLPAQWNETRNRFISPVIDDTARLSKTSSVPSDSEIWESKEYSDWFANRLLQIEKIEIFTGGSGYTIPPEVIIEGDADTPAKARARLNVFGQVSRIEITEPGSGYLTTPTINISGDGSGARAVAIMKTAGPRSSQITLRYDRFEYQTQVQDWEPSTLYSLGDLVRYENEVYRVSETNDGNFLFSNSEFVLENYERVPAEELSGIDRTAGYYVSAPRSVGEDLPQLVDGIDYPGVQVDGPNFNENTGFDVSAFDNVPFDNIDIGLETEIEVDYVGDGSTTEYSLGYPDDGLVTTVESVSVDIDGIEKTEGVDYTLNTASSTEVATILFDVAPPADSLISVVSIITRPTYSESILDVSYSSNFADSFLGTDPAPAYGGSPDDTRDHGIVVNGGKFIDTFSSHAPEELVPGSTFDTLDMTVNTRVGVDTCGNGHGWKVAAKTVQIQSPSLSRVFDLPELATPTTAIVVTNLTSGKVLSEKCYEVDWVNNTLTITCGASTGNIVRFDIFGLGGGNHLFSKQYPANEIAENKIDIPVRINEINEILILVDGKEYKDFTFSSLEPQTEITLIEDVNDNSLVSVFVLGDTENNFSYSYPFFEYFQYDGTSRVFELDERLEFSNKSHAIVEVNGFRLEPPNGIHHITDESTLTYNVSRDDDIIDPDQIGEIDVAVYINDEELRLGTDFVLDPSDGSSIRTITLVAAPNNGDRLSIYVRTLSDYVISAGNLRIRDSVALSPDDTITVRTWKDTREQRLITKVFRGPIGELEVSRTPFDVFPYDTDRYDEQVESTDFVTVFNIGTTGAVTSRAWVTLNGKRLIPHDDYIIEERENGDLLEIIRPINNVDDIIAITVFGVNTVPDPLRFKIFDDMRGNQTIHRMIDNNIAALTQELAASDDVIHVTDASVLVDPFLEQRRFGVVFINGERITYRNRNLIDNTLTGIRRGTAGTGVYTHLAGEEVVDGTRSTVLENGKDLTWYDLGDETILTGRSLQASQNMRAQFLKGF